MTKNQHQVTSKNSRPSAAPQPKTAHSRAGARPASTSPSIALFLKSDAGISEEVIDLSKAEYAALKRAAAPIGDGILMFMANAALEKIGRLGAAGETTEKTSAAFNRFVVDAVREKVSRESGASASKPIGADCDTWPILNELPAGNLVRDLAGRLFIVEQLKCSGYGAPFLDGARREVSYSEALAFITNHSWWKHPWKVLALHGIKRPEEHDQRRAA
jgi:hypothetical protein